MDTEQQICLGKIFIWLSLFVPMYFVTLVQDGVIKAVFTVGDMFAITFALISVVELCIISSRKVHNGDAK